MSKTKQTNTKPLDPIERERMMINLAEECAEKQLREGTASSQVITHYLKLGTQREAQETELLKNKNRLAEAQISAIESSGEVKQLYEEALKAFSTYRGDAVSDEESTNIQDTDYL